MAAFWEWLSPHWFVEEDNRMKGHRPLSHPTRMATPEVACVVCQGPVVQGEFIRCDNSKSCTRNCRNDECQCGHPICDDCLVHHVEAIPRFRLNQHKGRVACPAANSDGAAWHGAVYRDEDIARAFFRKNNQQGMARYLAQALPDTMDNSTINNPQPRNAANPNTAGNVEQAEATDVERHVRNIHELLNRRCPGCFAVLDPNPNGCPAVRCANCGCHFCWLCLQISGDTRLSHDHVRSHGVGLFPTAAVRSSFERRLHAQHIRQHLSSLPRNTQDRILERAGLEPQLLELVRFDTPRHRGQQKNNPNSNAVRRGSPHLQHSSTLRVMTLYAGWAAVRIIVGAGCCLHWGNTFYKTIGNRSVTTTIVEKQQLGAFTVRVPKQVTKTLPGEKVLCCENTGKGFAAMFVGNLIVDATAIFLGMLPGNIQRPDELVWSRVKLTVKTAFITASCSTMASALSFVEESVLLSILYGGAITVPILLLTASQVQAAT